MLDVAQISMNEYCLDEIVGDELPEKYFYTDDNEILIASNIVNTEESVHQLINFLFQNASNAIEVYRCDHAVVLDLSQIRKQLISFHQLESSYQHWIIATGRENTMDEYGMLIDYIGHAKRTMAKKYLFLVISDQRNTK